MSQMSVPRDAFDLVGRERELARLAELAAAGRAEGGRARAVLVTGVEGIGKSRLLAELKRGLRADGETVFEGRCHVTDRRPYAALVDVLGAAASLLGDLGYRTPALERALGHLAGLPPGGDRDAAGEDALLRFCESVRLALLEVARVRPPVVFLHDVHRADSATAGLLRYLLENLLADPAFDWAPDAVESAPAAEGFRGLLVLSFRESPSTRPFVELARASAVVEHLPLEPLDASGVAAFLQQRHVVERLLAASGGLPAALEQIIDSVPARPDDLWTRRLEAVPREAEPLLGALAVYERPVSPEQLADLVGSSVGVLPLLNDLVGRKVLARTLDRGAVRFRFVREALRETWCAGLDAEARGALHLRVARRLAEVGGMGAEPEEVAHHFLAAGRPREAVPFALEAAERLERAFAFARAAELLERVAAAADERERAHLLDRLAALYLLAGERGRAREVLTTLATEFPGHLEPAVLAERRARVHLAAGEPPAALSQVDAGLAAEPAPALRRRLQALGAEAAYVAGDLADAARRAEGVPDSADATGVALRNTLGKVHLAREALDEAQALFERNLDAGGDARARARALINLGIVHLQRGEPDAAAGRFEQALALAEADADLRNLAIALGNLAVLHHRRQNYRRALEFYHRSSAAFRKLGNQDQLTVTVLNLADLYLTVGDRDRAHRLADIAATHVRRGRYRSLEAQVTLLEGDLARTDGDPERAAGHYAAAIRLIEQGGGNNQRLGPLLLSQAEMLLESGSLAAADGLLDRVATLPEANRTDAVEARLRLVRGAVRTAADDPGAARAELEAAVSLALQSGDREVAWQALARLGALRWALGDRAGTLQALVEAVETIEQLAAELPRALRAGYRDTPRRRAVHEALRRVRAGLPPERPAAERRADRAAPRMRRPEADWQPHWRERYPDIIGRSPNLLPLFKTLDRVSGSDSMVLIRGESGTGKELVAQALHGHGPRAGRPFVKVNCGAFVETLLLSELFGHEKGAFTGALALKRGRFELAHTGTIFLDEIGDISPNTQVALLRVLQEGTFERVGGQETLQVDVRVIAATHRNLEDMVRRGEFRADLYYRLRGVVIELPPLRDRREDIPLLVRHFLSRRPHAEGRPLVFSREAVASLLQHDWPGNIRELENVVRSVSLFADGAAVGLAELAELGDIFRAPADAALLEAAERLSELDGPPPPSLPPPVPSPVDGEDEEVDDDDDGAEDDDDVPFVFRPRSPDDEDGHLFLGDGDWLDALLQQEGGLAEVKKRIEYEAIARALRATNGNITQAAKRLGMKRPRLSQIIHATPALGDLKGREVKT